MFAGAVSLAGLAGYVNVVVLGSFHVPVSHMSGAVSRLSIDVARGDAADMRGILSIIGGFLLGALFSGALIGSRTLAPGRRYGLALVVEGAVLAQATLLLRRGDATGVANGVALAAMACGIQNAMASSYYGLVLRTTHVTGIVTDLGVLLGHWVRHRKVKPWKLLLLASILVGFLAGGTVGALAFGRAGVTALGAAAAGCVVAGAAYYLWQHARVVRAARG